MRKLVLVGVSLVLTLTGVSAASAHAQLAQATPGPGVVVTTAPPRLSLTFDDNLIPQAGSNLVQVTDVSGKHFESASNLSGATLSTNLKKLTHFGAFKVAYRVLSADGHPVSASYTFYFRKKK